jgi:hypothetical protein
MDTFGWIEALENNLRYAGHENSVSASPLDKQVQVREHCFREDPLDCQVKRSRASPPGWNKFSGDLLNNSPVWWRCC